jgi:hypothetical protein
MGDECEACSFRLQGLGSNPSNAWVALSTDPDLENLKRVVWLLVTRMDEILNNWYGAYLAHFGDSCRLREGEFFQLFKPAIRDGLGALAGGRMIEFKSAIERLGEQFAERKVPLEEVVLTLQICEEMAFTIFSESGRTIELFRMLDKLVHLGLAIVIEAYFRAGFTFRRQRPV